MRKYGVIIIIIGIFLIISSLFLSNINKKQQEKNQNDKKQEEQKEEIIKTFCDNKEANNEFKTYEFKQFDNISFDFIDCLETKDDDFYYESLEKDYTLEFKIAIGTVDKFKEQIEASNKELNTKVEVKKDSKVVIGTSEDKSILSIISPFRDERLYIITITKEGYLNEKTVKKVIDSFKIERVSNDFSFNS
ncbi:MAG: hypothetical protein IJ568_02550 [Bacilli bacterium]|nr:hypothetical protein [Bacilli bacterium]